MKPNDRTLFVQGVASGSWLSSGSRRPRLVPQRGRAPFMSPVRTVVFGAESTEAEKKQKVGFFESILLWLDGGSYEVYGIPLRKFIIGLSLALLAFGIVLVSLMEAGGLINIIPPAWSPPPSPPPSPLPPSNPPLPPTPPLPPGTPPPPSSPPHPPLVTVLASSTCRHSVGGVIVILANNGRCEDGGSGSVASICEFGSDYPDCPERTVSS